MNFIAWLGAITGTLSLLIQGFSAYKKYFYKREDISAIIYRFNPVQPDGSQMISFEIGLVNNGNRNSSIANIALMLPNKEKAYFTPPAFDLESRQQIRNLKIHPGEIIGKTIYFPQTGLKGLLQHQILYGFETENNSSANIGLKFTTINSEGKSISTEYGIFSISVIKDEGKIIGGGMYGIEPILSLLTQKYILRGDMGKSPLEFFNNFS